MKIVTVNVPQEYLHAIEKLTGENGLYPSRSELVRVAVRDFLIRELSLAKTMTRYHEKQQQEEDHASYADTKLVRVPIDTSKDLETSELLESIIVFNNPFFDKVLQCLIKNKNFISPDEVARQTDITAKTAKEQLKCLHDKFGQIVKERYGNYQVDTTSLKAYLRAHNQKTIIENLETCLKILKKDKDQKKEQQFKTYKIIRRLEY
jgi:Arc/MetJ-type ribon-helix-helix transcriptional regulator